MFGVECPGQLLTEWHFDVTGQWTVVTISWSEEVVADCEKRKI